MTSPTKHGVLDHVTLVQASANSPWSVDATAAIPAAIVVDAMNGRRCGAVVGGATAAGRWTCLVTRNNEEEEEPGSYGLSVWYAPPAATLPEQKHRLPVATLSHARLQGSSRPPLLQAAVSPSRQDTLYLYAINPDTGDLVLWKIPRQDLARSMPPQPGCLARIDLGADGAPHHHREPHRVGCLTVQWRDGGGAPVILAGTTHGRIYWIAQSPLPLSLFVQRVEPAAASSGVLRRLWNRVQYHESVGVAALLPVSPREFLSVSRTGRIVRWGVAGTESFRALFAATEPVDLLQAWNEEERDRPVAHSLRVVRAALGHAHLHIIALTEHDRDEYRLHWLRLQTVYGQEVPVRDLSSQWLDRFVSPETVEVNGLTVSDNGVAYAAFTQGPGLPVVAAAWDAASGTECDLDLPVEHVKALLPGTVAGDVVTHGFTVLDASGLGFRIRYLRPEVGPASPGGAARGRGQAEIAALAQHLSSVFWQSYTNPDRSVPLTPKLTHAAKPDLEAAVLAFAVQLQQKGDLSSKQNPLEWHLHLITFLQETGVYRDLSLYSKWRLLAVGSEVAVFWALGDIKPANSWEETWLEQLKADEVGEWLRRVQESALSEGSGETVEEAFLSWLCVAMETAMVYREDRAAKDYYVEPNAVVSVQSSDEVPVWTSSPAVQSALSEQLSYWNAPAPTGAAEMVETVVQYALQSCGDSFAACPCERTRTAYVTAQQGSFDILRQLNKDELAFQLSIGHRYFAGACQIAFDHERKRDRESYSLDPLFDEMSGQLDVETGYPFGMFVLKWYADKGLHGQVLTYGKHCPDELGTLIESMEALQPYRWILASRKGNYDQVANSLVENAQRSSFTLSEAKTALSIAALANTVVEKGQPMLEDSAVKRRRFIDKKKELINAQQELYGEGVSDSTFWSADALLDSALDKFKDAPGNKEKADICIIALAICTSFDSAEETRDKAVTVWTHAILADAGIWEKWMHSETNLADSRLREQVLQNTVFGELFRQSEEMPDWEEVVYAGNVERGIFNVVDHPLFTESLKRLLRSVTSDDHDLSRGVSGDWMMVSND